MGSKSSKGSRVPGFGSAWVPSSSRTAMLCHPRGNATQCIEQAVDVRGCGSEVHDAGAQGEAAADHGVREIRIAVALDLEHQALVEGIEIRLSHEAGASTAISEADDAERGGCQQFEV